MKAIRDILLKEWDPIGIYRAGPDDEYDSYIWPIFQLVESGADATKVTDCLCNLENDIMGSFPENKDEVELVSEKLVALKEEMDF